MHGNNVFVLFFSLQTISLAADVTVSSNDDYSARGIKSDQGREGVGGLPGFDGRPDNRGLPGQAEEKGVMGNKGATGIGYEGPKGDPGLIGDKGDKVDSGYAGHDGQPGPMGRKGEKGERGNPGLISMILAQGEKGDKGEAAGFVFGPKGERGPPGLPGADRIPEMDGPPCPAGINGAPCQKGDRGFEGRVGQPGPVGPPGLQGLPGERGEIGITGLRGPTGPPGAPCVETHYSSGILVAFHSQERNVPPCPNGLKKIWDGYSLLFMDGNEKAHNQDLGHAGSCVIKFSTMPFLFCDLNEVCDYASGSDRSYWLSTNETTGYIPVQGMDIPKYISRCVVCEAPANVIAFHSQSSIVPPCPSGWAELWSGYSFVMHTGAGGQGGGQALESPGSCLKNFHTIPFIECNGTGGTCHKFANQLSFWLAIIDHYLDVDRPQRETLTRDRTSERVGRCVVCMKNTKYTADQEYFL